ncbi:MAG: YfiR family protein [Candidatus Eisenbacteria bacterium]
MRRGLVCVFLLTSSLAAVCAVPGPINAEETQPPVPIEYQVKAAFLYRFMHFVEWPEELAPKIEGAVIIGVIGNGPMHAALVAITASSKYPQRLVIKRFDDPQDLEFCHMLFISASAEGQSKAILKQLGDRGTLTVGEFDGFARQGGMINFIIVDKVVRFEINPDSAKRANLKISSKLLRLAKIVNGGR